MNFNHLILSTEYSTDKGIVQIPKLFEHGNLTNMSSIAITDTNNLFGAVHFSQMAYEKGIKAIYGTSLIIKDNYSRYHTLYFLCKNASGYRSLCALISAGFNSSNKHSELPYYNIEQLKSLKDVFCITGGMYGQLGYHLLYDPENARKICDAYLDIFGENLIIDIHRVYKDYSEHHYVKRATDLANKLGLPVIATNYVCFLSQKDYITHTIKQCIVDKKTIYSSVQQKLSKDMYFKSTEDMSQLFYDLPESISNTQYIAERCNLVIPTDNLALFPKYAATSYRDRCNVLTDMAYTGAQTRLAHIDEQRKIELYFPRLEYELATIISRGYVDYFLTVADFTNWAHKNNIPVGPGRGSGASSLLAFCLNITSVDPIRYKLLFERFLNIERESYPDFDIDFCFENRERIIDYIKQRYGANKVAQIISHSTLSAKIVLKDVCRVMGIKFQEANNMTKFISIKQGTKLLSAIETSSFLKKISSRGITKLVFKHSLDLEGIVRGSTRHAAGIIISHCPIEDLGYFCHGDELEHKVVQWDMISLEKLGFLKCDILGLRTLTSIQKTIELVAQTTGKRICFAVEDSLDDRATYDFIHTGNTDGIFQLESPGMQSVLQQLPVSDITDIIAIIALYRPGPMRSGMLSSYINIKNEKKAIQALHPLLNDILNETYGLIIYQEQIMQTARIMSGFSLGAGDKLQRVISKKQIAAIESFQTAFIRGAIVNGIEEGTAISVFNIIKEFAEYGFNKAHATSYAILTYYTAFLKLHHTVQFYIALLSTESTQINKYLVAALCDYINILPPCINDSYWEFTYVNNNTMRFGLGAVKGIGYSHYLAIENERKLNGKFQNLYDFINRVFKGKTAIKFCEILVECGALDCFLIDKDKLILQIELIFKKCKQANIEKLNSLEPWIDYPVRGSDYFSKKENMRLTINLSYNILKMHNFWLARIGNTSYISRRQVYNHVGVLLEWHAFHERIIIKTLFNREIRYFFLSPDKFCNKITAGSLMIFHSYNPLYVHSFYHKKFANCISCSTIEDLINQTINQILISISYEKIDMLIKALEYCFSYHKDNNLFLNTVTLKVIVKNNISNGEYLLQKEIKVSAYSLIQMLQPNFTLNYVFRN